ncbi:MAG TPA: DUF2277 domain-containing protein [Trueperaceae bacterium]|nr:DUF2277 domain-containing protein [Trueperaceae bacterium]
MCRNIRPLFNYDPPSTEADARDAALQFVRKVSGYNKPSEVNREAFDTAVDEIARAANVLLASLQTTAPPRDRAAEIEKARLDATKRFGAPAS